MTRQELLDLLLVERFAPTVRVEATSHIPRLGADPDAETHARELLEAISTNESTGCAHLSPAQSTRTREESTELLTAAFHSPDRSAFNGAHTQRKGA